METTTNTTTTATQVAKPKRTRKRAKKDSIFSVTGKNEATMARVPIKSIYALIKVGDEPPVSHTLKAKTHDNALSEVEAILQQYTASLDAGIKVQFIAVLDEFKVEHSVLIKAIR